MGAGVGTWMRESVCLCCVCVWVCGCVGVFVGARVCDGVRVSERARARVCERMDGREKEGRTGEA